jgi:hypothetical protein
MPSITITFGEMTPIDLLEPMADGDGPSCPPATRNPEINEENKAEAVEEYGYRDPADDGGFRLTDVCGNCAAFNQSEDMLECIGDESGETGYCQSLKFVCSSAMTCDKWVSGGPITDEDFDFEGDVF